MTNATQYKLNDTAYDLFHAPSSDIGLVRDIADATAAALYSQTGTPTSTSIIINAETGETVETLDYNNGVRV